MRMPNYKKFFKKILKETEKMSTCARMQVGCLIVRDGRIISTGWNGVPAEQEHCKDYFLERGWNVKKDYLSREHNLWSTKHEIHAETNAIGYAAQNGVLTKGASLYTSVSPCIDCAKLTIAAGITSVFYMNTYDRSDDGQKFLNMNEVYMEKL